MVMGHNSPVFVAYHSGHLWGLGHSHAFVSKGENGSEYMAGWLQFILWVEPHGVMAHGIYMDEF